MKPILFNTDMVRAILEGRKTVTRRVVKEPYYIDDEEMSRGSGLAMHRGTSMTDGMPYPDQPYRPGDILYVRETWCRQPSKEYPFVYKASVETPAAWKWRPSIHMPREAARIFLRVKDVRVERLQEITEEQAQAEGVKGWMVATDRDWDKNPNHLIAFRHLWDSTIKKADRALYGWDANLWVWVIEFERCEKPEGGAT